MILSSKDLLLIDVAVTPVIDENGYAKLRDFSKFYEEVSKIFLDTVKLGGEKGVFSCPVNGIKTTLFREIFGGGPFPALIDDAFVTIPFRDKLPITVEDFPFMHLFLDVTPRISQNISYIASLLGHTFYGLRFGTDALFLSNITEILSIALKSRAPLYFELKSEEGLSRVSKLIQDIEAKERYFDIPIILGHCGMSVKSSVELLKRSNVYGDISLLPLPNLERLVFNLKDVLATEGGYKKWSDKLLFGSGFPFATSENVAKVLAYLFSRRLGATIDDISKVLGLNAMKIIEPEVTLGKARNFEPTRESVNVDALFRKIGYLHKRGLLIMRHFEPFLDSRDYSEGVLTIMSPSTGDFASFMIYKNSLVSLPSMELRKIFTRSIESFSKVPELNNAFSSDETTGVLENCLREVGVDISTIPFDVIITKNENPVVSISPSDAEFIGVNPGDLVNISFEDKTRHHARVIIDNSIERGKVGIPPTLCNIWPVSKKAFLRKTTLNILPLDSVEIAIVAADNVAQSMPKNIIVPEVLLSRNERLLFHFGNTYVLGQVLYVSPHIEKSAVGMTTTETEISIVPTATLPVNLIIALDTSGEMIGGEITVEPDILNKVVSFDPRFRTLEIKGTVSRGTAAVILGSILIEELAHLLPVDKISLLHFDTFAEVFRALEETELKGYIQYQGDVEFIMPLVTSFFLDKCTLLTGNPEAMPLVDALRSLKDEFNDDNPIVLIIIGSGKFAGNVPPFSVADKVLAIAIDANPADYGRVFSFTRTLSVKTINRNTLEIIKKLVK